MKYYLAALILIITANASAQERVHPFMSDKISWSFGVKGGVNVSMPRATLPQNVTLESLNRAHLGFTFNKRLVSNLVFLTSMVISGQGYTQIIPPDSTYYGTPRSRIRFTYLNIPVMLLYQTQSGFGVQAGPQVGLYLGGDYYDNYYFGDEQNQSTFSLVGGVSFVTKAGLGAEINYCLGLTEYIQGYNYNQSPVSIKNDVLQFSVVWYFAIAKKRPAR
ncbi:MAG TPA: porin family protein [Flavisolibacter sp.]